MSYAVSVLAILTAVTWLCLALPTPAERAVTLDKIGTTTGVNWR